jgi:hypothetical protein
MLILVSCITLIASNTIDIKSRIESSSRAIGSFIEIMKEKYYIEFELVILGDDNNLMKIVNKIMKKSTVPMNIRFDKRFNKATKKYNLCENKSSIVLASHDKFSNEFKFEQNLIPKSLYCLVYCPYATEEDNFYSSDIFFN